MIGRLAALGRFIARFTDRLKSFFTTKIGAKQTGWNMECDEALMAIKQYLTEPPILASPETSKTLYLYTVVSDVSVSAALFKEDEHWKQKLVFLISKSLSEVETQYTRLEHATLALGVAAKELCPYF